MLSLQRVPGNLFLEQIADQYARECIKLSAWHTLKNAVCILQLATEYKTSMSAAAV